MNDITSHIGMQTRCIHGTYTPPPQDTCLPFDKTALRRDFWNRWDTLTNEARNAHRWPQHRWVTHLNAMNQLLAIAPCRWLRRLHAFCKKPFLPLDTEGTWIYAVWSVKTERVYIGQTGGIAQLKRAIVRFMQHMRAARSWHTLYGRRGIRGMGLLYPTMFRLGPENFGVVILEACPKNAADARELFWIRKMGRTLNVRGVYPTDRRCKLLLNGHMIMPKYTKAQLARMTHHITDKLKYNVPIHVQVKILTWAKKHFQGPIRNRCYQKVAHRVKMISGLSLPKHVPLRMPAMSSTHTFPFMNLFKDFLRSLPIPLHYRDYLVHSTHLISTRNPTASQLLQDNIKYDTVDDMRQAAAATCQCHTLPKRLNIPVVQGHLFIRHPKLLRRVFGTDSRVLLQHGNNDVCPTWQSVCKSVVKSARDVLTRLLPERIADAKASQFYSSLLSCARQCWRTQHIMAPWYAWEQCVRAVREKWTPQWVFEGCDKNMGKIAAVCRVGMLQRTLADSQDQQQFEVLHIAPSKRDARDWAMQHIRNQAAMHGIDKSRTTGAKKGPPTVRDVPKNKLDELKNWRVTPQHFCIDILPGHLWHATIWPFLNDTVAFWSLCVANTYMLAWAVRNVMQTIRFEPWDGIYWRLRRLICRIVNNARHLPAHWGTAPRLLSPLRPIEWKTRLVFSHYRHPLRARGRHISRCLHMLITEGARVLNTLDMPHCKDLLTTVRQWNQQLHDGWHEGELTRPVALFELDIKAMFPSLDRQNVWESISAIADLVAHAPGPRGRPRRGLLRFAVNRIDRKLDRIGSGSPELYHNIDIQQVLRYVYFDIFCNDAFVFSNWVLRQKRGLAIGGPCSYQLASAKCMLSEHLHFPLYLPLAPTAPGSAHPCHLPATPGRFRDNINGVMFADTPQELLQTTFEGIYNLDLQWEGWGDHWITLQGDMTVNPQNPATHPPSIRLCLADKSQKHTAAHQFLMRYADAHAPKAKGTLKSLVPTLAKNSGYYRDTRVDAQKNVKLITSDLAAKGYPNTWWAPLLHKCLKKWGLSPCA